MRKREEQKQSFTRADIEFHFSAIRFLPGVLGARLVVIESWLV